MSETALNFAASDHIGRVVSVDPLWLRGNTVSKSIRLRELFKRCRVHLLALDEFQHFVDVRRASIPNEVDRQSTELFILFDDSRISRNSTPSSPDCSCADRGTWGKRDIDPFLGII